MKNREFYREEILNFDKTESFCRDFIEPKILGSYGLNCLKTRCSHCSTLRMLWFEEERKEPEVDWTKVEVDTPILVSGDKENWEERHFAYVKNGKVYVWDNGRTSWTARDTANAWNWEYAKLVEKE